MLHRSWRRLDLSGCDALPPRRQALWLIVLVVATTLLLASGCSARREEQGEPIPFARFLEAVADGDLVDEQPVTITPETVTAVIRTEGGERTVVATIPPGFDRAEFVDQLSSEGFEVEGRP
jgi:hypothetical protein